LEFPDGRVEEYSMNIIMENLMSQVDEYGYDVGFFDEICGANKNEQIAITQGDHTFTEVNGIRKPIITTKGWSILIKWKDQSTNWVPLSIAKESFPTQVAEYAISNGLQYEPAFRWWVNHCLKKHDHIIKVTKTNRPHQKGCMKYAIILPATVEEAISLNQEKW
jgi:hypothetical protein